MTKVQLSEFCDIVQGGRLRLSGNDFVEVGFPAYGAGGINGYLPEFEYDREAVVLSAIGARCGKCFYANDKWSSLANTQLILPEPTKADAKFLWFQLNDEARWPRSGTGQPFIRPSDVKRHTVYLPPLNEQRRIVAVLDQADNLRSKRRIALEALDQLISALFFDMFGDPSGNFDRWQVSTLGDISIKITDGEHLNPVFSESGMPIVMAGHVLDDAIDLESCRKVAMDLGRRFRKKCDPQPGDLLLVGRGATIGRITIVQESTEFCLMGSVILIKPNANLVAPLFLTYLLKHPSMHARLYATSGSSAQQAIYLKDVRSLLCILPPLNAQRDFANKIRSVNSLKFVQRGQSSRLDDLFVSLKRDAFVGKLGTTSVEAMGAPIQRKKLASV